MKDLINDVADVILNTRRKICRLRISFCLLDLTGTMPSLSIDTSVCAQCLKVSVDSGWRVYEKNDKSEIRIMILKFRGKTKLDL